MNDRKFTWNSKLNDITWGLINSILRLAYPYLCGKLSALSYAKKRKLKCLMFDTALRKDRVFPCYSVEYEEDFSIKYLRDKWKKDFGVEIDIPTHKKMLFRMS